MKKLICGLSALAIMAMPVTVFADTTINEKSDPQSANAVISTEIAPAYIVTIPADTTVKFNDTETDFGAVELTKAQLEPNKVVKVTLTTDNKMENAADSEKVLPYAILNGEDEYTSAEYTTVGDKTELTISITEDDWNAAYAGEYSDTVTFDIEYTDAAAE